MSTSDCLERLSAFDTNTISDALDFLSLPGASYGLRPLWDCPKIVGRASTVKLRPKTDASPTTHLFTTTIDAVTTDDRILVVSGGIEQVSCWGDILANASTRKHIRGTIIDGMSRDIDGSRDIGYPVYGRGVTMISARNRMVQVDAGIPLQIRGVTVHQDDYVIADTCGTVFIPSARINDVLDLASRIAHRQTLMIQAINAGQPVSEVMHDTNFADIATSIPTLPSHRQLKPPNPKDTEVTSLFTHLSTPAVSDALDRLSLHGQVSAIMPLTNYTRTYVGPAFTVRYVPASSPPGSVGDFLDDVSAGDFVVIDNAGRTDCTVWGDILTSYACLQGICGTVIDGVCRDVSRALSEEYPIFSKGRWMRTGKDRVEVGGVNEVVGVGGVRVAPGDIVVADANGVVVVPRRWAGEVARVAAEIERCEEEIRRMVAEGETVAEAREKAGYHTLQRRGD